MPEDPRRPSCRECDRRIEDLSEIVHIYWLDGEYIREDEDSGYEFETWLCRTCAPEWFDCSFEELKEDESVLDNGPVLIFRKEQTDE